MKRFLVLGIVLAGLLAGTAQAHNRVLRPAAPNGALVLYVHGAGGTANAINEGPNRRLTHALLRNGYAVAADDADGTENWGNPASVEDYVHLVRRLDYRQVAILAVSMGGLDGVQLIDRIHPIAFAGIFPVCNLNSLVGNKLLAPDPSALFREAWRGQPPGFLSPVKAKEVKGLPVILWASPEDKVVPMTQNADVCAQWMRNEGARVTEISTEGEHGDASNFRPHRLLDFLRAVDLHP